MKPLTILKNFVNKKVNKEILFDVCFYCPFNAASVDSDRNATENFNLIGNAFGVRYGM